MPTDPRGEPWPDRTYNGFAGASSGYSAAAPPPRRRVLPRISGRAIAVGGVAAIALGLVLGVWARPNFGKDPSAAAERSAPPVPIEVNRPPPQAAPTSNGKLEVLSPDQAAQARAQSAAAYPATPAPSYVPAAPPPLPSVSGPSYAPSPRAPSAPAPSLGYREPPPAPAVRAAPSLPVEPPRMAQAQPQAQPAFNCAGGRTLSEALVCGDPEIASIDREMSRAYRRALQSGSAPPGQIRSDQRDWLNIREDAAHRGRRALMQVYQQRLQELNQLADSDRPDD